MSSHRCHLAVKCRFKFYATLQSSVLVTNNLSSAYLSLASVPWLITQKWYMEGLKKSIWKLTPGEISFFSKNSSLLGGHVLLADSISVNSKKVWKVINWPVLKNSKRSIPSWDLCLIIGISFTILLARPNACTIEFIWSCKNQSDEKRQLYSYPLG